jgi:hypothetical protein
VHFKLSGCGSPVVSCCTAFLCVYWFQFGYGSGLWQCRYLNSTMAQCTFWVTLVAFEKPTSKSM